MFIEKNILHFIYNEGLYIDRKIAEKTVADRIDYADGCTYAIFADIRGLKEIDTEARDFLGTKKASEGIRAVAVFSGKNNLLTMLGNFYLKFNKPPAPTRIFNDKNEAIRWLELFDETKMN